jgi:phage protein D
MTTQVKQYIPSYRIVVQGTELLHGASVDVLSVSVTDSFDRADSFNFTMRERHPEHGRLFAGGAELQWLDSDVFQEGNEVEIHLGYAGDLHLMLRGEITAVTPSFPESGQPTLRVEGFSLYHALQRQRRREPFESATDSGIAREIAGAMGLTAEVDETEAEHPLFSPKGANYAQILQERASRIGYEVTIKDRTLYFQQPCYLSNPSPALTLEWGRNLRSFNPRLSTHNMVTQVTVRASQTSQGRSKEPLVGEARAGDERVKMGSETGNQIAQRVFGENSVLIEDHSVASAQEANEIALAQLEARALGFITGTGASIGDPQLRARTVIELIGLGRGFSGRYYVTSTTHSVNTSGYQTNFEVKRNGK